MNLRNRIIAKASSSGGIIGAAAYLIASYFSDADWDQLLTLSREYLPDGLTAILVALVTGTLAGYHRAQPAPDTQSQPEPEKAPQEPPQAPPVTVLKPKKNWFTDAETDCKCQGYDDCNYQGMDPTVMDIANDLREQFGPIIVNSGYRCPQHNRAVGGSAGSYHPKGKALDVKSPTISPETLYTYLDAKYPKRYGFGLYDKFVHIDSRSDSYTRKASPEAEWTRVVDIPLA